MRRGRAFAVAVLTALVAAAPAGATTLPSAFTPPCPTYGDLQICSGDVPSFDGSTLDVDLTLPMRATGARHPLMIMLHGFGNNKREWESLTSDGDGADKAGWNSHWFAQHGYYVLTYTARGFRDGSTPAYAPATPGDGSQSFPAHPNGTIHVRRSRTADLPTRSGQAAGPATPTARRRIRSSATSSLRRGTAGRPISRPPAATRAPRSR